MFHLTSVSGTGTLRSIQVVPTISSGTMADGTWTATVQVPSTADGTWTLSTVTSCDASDCQWLPVAVTAPPEFTVVGHHQPRLSMGVVPDPLPYPRQSGVVKGRVVDSDTGLGMPGVQVAYGLDTGCVNEQGGGGDGPALFRVVRTTTARGYFRFAPSGLLQLNCLAVLGTVRLNSDGYSALPVFRRFGVDVKPLVTTSASATSATTGARVGVHGLVFDWGIWDGRGRVVQVQQLHGRTAWRTVATVSVRLSGRWSTSVVPTARGTHVYRAFTPAIGDTVASASRPFTITAT